MIRPTPKILSMAASLGLACLAMPATAQVSEIVVKGGVQTPPGTDPVTMTVNIADIDLSTEAGEAEMYDRVKAAIKHICWSHPKPARWQVRDSEECDEFAWSSVKPQMEDALEKASDG